MAAGFGKINQVDSGLTFDVSYLTSETVMYGRLFFFFKSITGFANANQKQRHNKESHLSDMDTL